MCICHPTEMADVFKCIRIQDSAGAWAEELHRALSAQEESINAQIYTRPLIRLRRCYLSKLPDGILAKVFREVAAESSRHVLGIVKTSKHFHDIAIPLLYSRLELLPGRSREDMQSLGLSFRRHPERRGHAREAKLRGGPEVFRSLGQFPVLFSSDAFPNIKRLHGVRVTVGSLQNLVATDEGLSTGTSTIEEVILEESEIRISPAGIDALMGACRVVRKLVLHWGRGAGGPPGDGEFLQEAMGSAIARHAATLETLEFKPNESQVGTDKENETGGLKDRLPSFTALKDLTIHMACFYGGGQALSTANRSSVAQNRLADFLPPCLERLALAGVPETPASTLGSEAVLECAGLRLQIIALLHQCGPDGRFSRLRLVQLPEWVNNPIQGRDGETLPQLKTLASNINVSVIFKGKSQGTSNSDGRFPVARVDSSPR